MATQGNTKLSQLNGGTPVAYSRATDNPVGVRGLGGTPADYMFSGLMEIAPPLIACGAALAVTAAMSGQPIRLDTAAGSVATLPAATGSGATWRFIVTVTATSNAHKILPASSADFMQGCAIGEHSNTPLSFFANPAASHSIQMPFAGTQPSGGFAGDEFYVTDIAANLFQVRGTYQAGVTPTTPFSTATT